MEAEQSHRVLIVDDERSNLAMLNKILSPEYTILIAKSGEDALGRAEEDNPDIILLDIVMAGMDGFETLARLKDSPVTSKIPVIIITGLSEESDEERGFFLGAVDYITKPFKNAIVQARVRTHMQIVHQMRMIERIGLIDPLTDIPNRRSFDNRADMEWRRCTREENPISFLMMDIDNFKTYNDTYGHPQGDVLLKSVAKILASEAKRPADMAARLGGEEFGLLLANTNLEKALTIAEKIRSKVEANQVPTADGKTMTSVTISIGAVSTVPRLGDSMLDFITRADGHLYTAKNTGRNRIFS
ncbi:MAG: diguanylate cyclase [Synergistaceae bacterium]|jgi:diguanylate cyclase (GGDEF)-like protein|nr:diguanylate cyclase [Synergistaceae bacterium]